VVSGCIHSFERFDFPSCLAVKPGYAIQVLLGGAAYRHGS
jgi:hypothetical protein